MSPVGRVAGAASIIEGAWPLYVVLVGRPFALETFCPAAACSPQTFSQTGIFGLLFPGLGLLLVVVGAFGVWGARGAFRAGAVLSALLLAVAGYAYISDSVALGQGSPYSDYAVVAFDELAAALLGVIGMVANIAATRRRSSLPEQVNPMNLPVFG